MSREFRCPTAKYHCHDRRLAIHVTACLRLVFAFGTAQPCATAFDHCAQARIEFLSTSGIIDLRYCHAALPVHVEQLDRIDVGNEAVASVGPRHSPMSQLMIQSFRPMEDAMVANAVVGQSDARTRRALPKSLHFLCGAA